LSVVDEKKHFSRVNTMAAISAHAMWPEKIRSPHALGGKRYLGKRSEADEAIRCESNEAMRRERGEESVEKEFVWVSGRA
jgi:hypothetical protein